jgi:signal peptidase II
MKFLLFLSLPLLALDQFTKWLVLRYIPSGHEIPVVPGFFSLVHVTNTGAAFGMFQHKNSLFVLLAIVALAAIAFFLIRDPWTTDPKKRQTMLTKIALSLLAAGVLGNLIDRLFRGSVVDFLNFYFREYVWPSFNVADSCICIAAGLLILGSFFNRRTDEPMNRRADKPIRRLGD